MKDINKIFEEKPKENLWKRIDERLENERGMRRLKIYKIATLAATFVALIAAVAYFNHLLQDHNPHLFASNESFTSLTLEDLEYDNNGMFNMNELMVVRKAYNTKFDSKSNLELSGFYQLSDGEISIEIRLEDMTYMLDFNYEGFPLMQLRNVSGQSLFFVSENGKELKLNIEPYGLKILESNFLPEYKGYKFMSINEL